MRSDWALTSAGVAPDASRPMPLREAGEALVVGDVVLAECERHEDFGVRGRKEERGRHDADDAIGLAAQAQVAADDVRIGVEAVAPERVAQHRDAVVADGSFVVAERAAERGADAERGEQRRRHLQRAQPFRRADAEQVEIDREEQRAVRQRGDAAAAVEVVRNRLHAAVGVLALLRVAVLDVDERGVVAIGEAAEIDAVDQVRDEHVRADADRERQHHRRREARPRGDAPRRVAHVVPEVPEHRRRLRHS